MTTVIEEMRVKKLAKTRAMVWIQKRSVTLILVNLPVTKRKDPREWSPGRKQPKNESQRAYQHHDQGKKSLSAPIPQVPNGRNRNLTVGVRKSEGVLNEKGDDNW
jgi:hypothetical protein